MRLPALALLTALLSACSPETHAVATSSSGTGAGGGTSASSSSAGTGGATACFVNADCPASLGDACHDVHCDPTGKDTAPGSPVPGCYLLSVCDAGPPAPCASSHDCPMSFPGQAICTVTACDLTGAKTDPASKVPGCYAEPAALASPCFMGCPGFCSGGAFGQGGTPPWTCSYPPGSACLDGG